MVKMIPTGALKNMKLRAMTCMRAAMSAGSMPSDLPSFAPKAARRPWKAAGSSGG